MPARVPGRRRRQTQSRLKFAHPQRAWYVHEGASAASDDQAAKAQLATQCAAMAASDIGVASIATDLATGTPDDFSLLAKLAETKPPPETTTRDPVAGPQVSTEFT